MPQQQTNDRFVQAAACIGITTAVLIPIFGAWAIAGGAAAIVAAKAFLDPRRK